MTRLGKRLLEAVREGVAIVKQEQCSRGTPGCPKSDNHTLCWTAQEGLIDWPPIDAAPAPCYTTGAGGVFTSQPKKT